MAVENGAGASFDVGSRARYFAPSFNDMEGILAPVDTAGDKVSRKGHALLPVSPNGGPITYYRLPREAPAPTPIP